MYQCITAKRKCVFVSFLIALYSFSTSQAISQTQPSKNTSRYQQAKQLANKHSVSVIGGGISGTYIRFATDMANVLNSKDENGLRIIPIVGLGGGQNMKDILFLKGIDMGVVQSEHLAYLKKQDPQLYNNIQDRVRYITKLYNSEWHLLANKNIKSLEDLRGKTVNLWKPVSATGIGGRTIFDIIGLDVNVVYIDTQSALEKLKNGEIAATSLLAGAPVKGFANVGTNHNFHFIPVDLQKYGVLLDTFLPAKLSAKDYPQIIPEGQEIQTVASSALLAVYNWPSETFRYKKLTTFVDQLFDNIDKFKKAPRHPKWKSINLGATVPGWKRFKPAEIYLQRFKPEKVYSKKKTRKTQTSSLQNDFQKFLKNNSSSINWSELTDEKRKEIFEQFLVWMKKTQ